MIKVEISFSLKEFRFSKEISLSREPLPGDTLIVTVLYIGKPMRVLVQVEKPDVLIEDYPISRYRVIPFEEVKRIFLASTESPGWCVINTKTGTTKPA